MKVVSDMMRAVLTALKVKPMSTREVAESLNINTNIAYQVIKSCHLKRYVRPGGKDRNIKIHKITLQGERAVDWIEEKLDDSPKPKLRELMIKSGRIKIYRREESFSDIKKRAKKEIKGQTGGLCYQSDLESK